MRKSPSIGRSAPGSEEVARVDITAREPWRPAVADFRTSTGRSRSVRAGNPRPGKLAMPGPARPFRPAPRSARCRAGPTPPARSSQYGRRRPHQTGHRGNIRPRQGAQAAGSAADPRSRTPRRRVQGSSRSPPRPRDRRHGRSTGKRRSRAPPDGPRHPGPTGQTRVPSTKVMKNRRPSRPSPTPGQDRPHRKQAPRRNARSLPRPFPWPQSRRSRATRA